jgi:hypothetical protein
MAKQLGRWRMTDELPFGARSGAFVTNPVDALARRIAARGEAPVVDEQYIHIHLPAPRTTRQSSRSRTRSHDAPATPTAFPVSAGDIFAVGDCGDSGFSLRRIRTSDTDKDGLPTPATMYSAKEVRRARSTSYAARSRRGQ